MDNENPDEKTTVHFYGGHADGGEAEFHMPPQSFDAPTKEGMRHPKGQAYTRYVHSDAWSHALGKWTMIPQGFPGKPPREKAAA